MNIPKPIGHGSWQVEEFSAYRARLGEEFDNIPDIIIESWFHRHWNDVQDWLVLEPTKWDYCLVSMPSDEILRISHVGDWPKTLNYWGNDLLDRNSRRLTWLGDYMLRHGTTPAPIIVAVDAGSIMHPRERGRSMMEPYQLIEGHLRLAYLQAMIRRNHGSVKNSHEVCMAKLRSNKSLHGTSL